MEDEEVLNLKVLNKNGRKMTVDEIRGLIKTGEKIDVEFKESKIALNKDVFDTVCSFSNRNGGHIFLGVNDQKEIIPLKQVADE